MTTYPIKKSIWAKASVLLFAFVLLFSAADLNAQTRSKKKKNDKPTFKDQIWYGGGVNLGFGGINGSNSFVLGLSPMVGYKVWGPFSVGPRLGFAYQWQRFSLGGPFYKANLFAFEPAMFARAKVYRGVFVHSEASISFEQFPTSIDGNGKVLKATERNNNTYLGAGINQSSGAFGYDIYLLWNFRLANDDLSQQGPLSYRFGFTYNF